MKKIIITDIGSTTTKALLLIKDNQNQLIFRDIQNSSTTVEKPFEDVNIGVFNSIKLLEKSTKLKLLRNSEPYNIIFEDDITYLSTSSAGGGLQILVVGLTLFDSGSSAKRAAFGAGGVLLDVFSIDDKRSNLEKINLIKILHPDIILFSGGTDNGAVTPIIRLGEILMLGSPKPKFSINSKLPLIYAGNKEVQPYISDLFADSYELHLIPNIRPALKKENLKPARDKIHELFMDSVMEQAPGYSRLKKVVNKDIIPTPSGVLNSLEILSTQNQGNILAVDIGGATTDIFSNMNDKFNRTVSANYGMSYSISNVMKDANFDKIKRWLPANLKENYIKNYISNKMLNPTFTTNNETLLAIEHAIAREALYLAKEQHLDMSFNSKRIGFLDKIKLKKNNKFMEKLYYAENLENEIFSLDDFDFFIGAGGVISHTKNNIQALQIIAAGLQAKGITKIWRDKHFITPHLGKLAEIDKESATKLLENDALKKLGMVIRPYGKKWKKGKKVIDITVNDKEYLVKVGDYIFIENKKQLNVNYSMHKGFAINNIDAGSFVTNYPMIIDATIPNEIDFEQINSELDLYDFSELISQESLFETENIEILEKTLEQTISLPYDGEI
ncbi:MAG: glutamate mutase L, partial [Candidatus Cloacimonadota bacterium]|nr:glutamate mutase L [Candidatus Cloacimonadota bacterium]